MLADVDETELKPDLAALRRLDSSSRILSAATAVPHLTNRTTTSKKTVRSEGGSSVNGETPTRRKKA